MSKSRGPTKAEQILAAAKERMDGAQYARDKARTAYEAASAVYDAHESAYRATKRLLEDARKPRTPKPAAPEVDTAKLAQATGTGNGAGKTSTKKTGTVAVDNATVGAQ